MTVDQIIALSASLGACLAAVATFLTVREMSKQRHISYHPELMVSRVILRGAGNPDRNQTLPANWVRLVDNEEVPAKFFSIPLVNVGFGVAKRVTVSWNFPIDECVKRINEIIVRTEIEGEISLRKGTTLFVESEKLGKFASLWGNQKKQAIDYVLPASVSDDPYPLEIPNAYIMAASIYLVVVFADHAEGVDPEIPGLSLEMSYEDISGRPHRSTFEISLQIFAFSGEWFQGYLEPKRLDRASRHSISN